MFQTKMKIKTEKLLQQAFCFICLSVLLALASMSNAFTVIPSENDLDAAWDEWEPPEFSFRQGNITNQTSSCKCGSGMSKINITKIVGGLASRNNAWPWIAAVVNTTGKPPYAICGGSLINNWFILTAAHCLDAIKNETKNFKIYLGGNKINGKNITGRQVLSIGAIRIHPGYSGVKTIDNDIGLIRLGSAAKFTKYVNPVCLNQKGDPFVGKDAIAAGWGKLLSNATTGSNVLREVHQTIISNADCAKFYDVINPQKMCATAPNKDTCNGDSGGPLIVEKSSKGSEVYYTQVGITSFGSKCGESPSGFTRVSKFLSFVKFNTKTSIYCSDSFT